METYTCEGNVVMIQSGPENGERVRMTCRNRDSRAAPTMLEAVGRVARYAREVMRTESAERYALKRFHFDRWCFCTRIDVLDERGRTVRSVDGETADWKPFLGIYEDETGEEGVMDSEQQEEGQGDHAGRDDRTVFGYLSAMYAGGPEIL